MQENQITNIFSDQPQSDIDQMLLMSAFDESLCHLGSNNTDLSTKIAYLIGQSELYGQVRLSNHDSIVFEV